MSVSNIVLAMENLRTNQKLTGDSLLESPHRMLSTAFSSRIPGLAPFIDVIGLRWSAESNSTAVAGSSQRGSESNIIVSPAPLILTKRLDSASAKLAAAMGSGDPHAAILFMMKAGTVPPLPFYGYSMQGVRVTKQEVIIAPGELEAVEQVTLSYDAIGMWFIPQGSDGQPQPQIIANFRFHSASR
jgi:type VI protein secretion system component Hcp